MASGAASTRSLEPELPAPPLVRETDAAGAVLPEPRRVSPAIPLEGGDAAREARRIMLLGALGGTTYLVVLWLCRGLLGFPASVYAILMVVIAVNLLCAATAARWAGGRVVPLGYACLHQLLWTAHLYFLGGLETGFFFFLNVFPVLYAAMISSEVEAFVTANVGVLSTAGLAVAETQGWLSPPGSGTVPLPVARAIGFVAVATVGLNYVACYANRYGSLLRDFAAQLHRQVARRTAALTIANTELATKARALEGKQDEIRTFVYSVTHDLKNPLSAILLTADALLDREGLHLSATAREDLEHIIRLAGGTEDMIRDLLELFQVTSEPETFCWVELSSLVERAVETLAPAIERKAVVVRVEPLPRVWGQRRKLGHVVENLLSNAVKYVPARTGVVTVCGGVEDHGVWFAVRDNGVGIPEAYRERVFKLFGRVPPKEQGLESPVEGTGVGLALVRRIVTVHGGTVTLTSTPGGGTTFTVRLPRGGEEHQG